MGRAFAWALLLLSLSLVFCSVREEKRGRRLDHTGRLVNRPKRNHEEYAERCPCPGQPEPPRQKNRRHECPCDGFPSSQPEHSHHRGKNKHRHNKKVKCHRFLKVCKLRMFQIPL